MAKINDDTKQNPGYAHLFFNTIIMEAKVKRIKITGKEKDNVVFSQNIFVSHIPLEGLKFSFELEGGVHRELALKDLLAKGEDAEQENASEEKEAKDEADKGDKE